MDKLHTRRSWTCGLCVSSHCRSQKRGGSFPRESKEGASDDADAATAAEASLKRARLSVNGTLHVLLKKAQGLDSADLNGKSDPYVVIQAGTQKHTSQIKPKTLNPVWNEDHTFEGTLEELMSFGLRLIVYDCDNPARPDKDDSLGELRVSLDALVHEDSHDFDVALDTRGKVIFQVSWEPPPEKEAEGAELHANRRRRAHDYWRHITCSARGRREGQRSSSSYHQRPACRFMS